MIWMMNMIFYIGIDEKSESKGHSPAKAAVHHDELIHGGKLVKPIVVGQGGEDQNT